MALKCGIVGLPNVGKSTLFNALTQNQVAAENYPFCTIDPNIGTVPVQDIRLDQIAKLISPQRVIPTTTQFVDIAGLVKGASKGEGLGNQFLANIRETDAIIHVVRCFADDNVLHVHDRVDPLSDIEIINTELVLADLDTCDKALLKLHKKIKAHDEESILEHGLLKRVQQHFNQGLPLSSFDATDDDEIILKRFSFLTQKPTLYLLNSDEEESEAHQTVRAYAKEQGANTLSICATLEAELASLDVESRRDLLEAYGKTRSGLDEVIDAGYHLLGLATYFTAGPKEVKAWTFPHGAKAPEAAGCIHTDFMKGFIRAEVTSFDDFIAYQGEAGAKTAGKIRLEGKDYIVQDGDIIHFRFNV